MMIAVKSYKGLTHASIMMPVSVISLKVHRSGWGWMSNPAELSRTGTSGASTKASVKTVTGSQARPVVAVNPQKLARRGATPPKIPPQFSCIIWVSSGTPIF